MGLNKDVVLILAARIVRMTAFGAVSTVLFLHMQALGLSSDEIGFFFSATILGDLLITIPLTTHADRIGRRLVLCFGAILKILSGFAFVASTNKWVLLLAGTLGVLTPTGNEIGPFMAVEQAALTAGMEAEGITRVYSIYNFLGYIAQAGGAMLAAWVVTMQSSIEEGYKRVFALYGLAAGLNFILYRMLSPNIEPKQENTAENNFEMTKTSVRRLNNDDLENIGNDEMNEDERSHENDERLPLTNAINASMENVETENPPSRFLSCILSATGLKRKETLNLVMIISVLFILDAFAGGFIMQTVVVAWFQKQFDMTPHQLSALVSGMNILAGISTLLVIPLARFGPLNVAVFSHLPSNVMIIFVPFMPTAASASAMILARSTLSQMDVPARQAFVAISVAEDERSAAGGITMIVRSVGTILAPIGWSPMMAAERNTLLFSMPFVVAGTIKIIYDLLLYFCFRSFEKSRT